MPNTLPPVKGAAFSFDVALVSQADTDVFKTSVTIGTADVTVIGDGVSRGNILAVPTEVGSTGVLTVALGTAETNYDRVAVLFRDAAGSEWQDALVTIYTAAQTFNTIDTNVDSILADTGTDGVVLANDAITSAKYDESTAFPIKSADAGLTQIARVGADGDTLETLSDQIDTVDANVDAVLADTGTDGVVVATGSKTGYSLAATGLNSITATAPGGVATTFPQMVVQLWRRFFKKATMTTTQLITYADDGETAETTQTVSDDAVTQTQGAAT